MFPNRPSKPLELGLQSSLPRVPRDMYTTHFPAKRRADMAGQDSRASVIGSLDRMTWWQSENSTAVTPPRLVGLPCEIGCSDRERSWGAGPIEMIKGTGPIRTNRMDVPNAHMTAERGRTIAARLSFAILMPPWRLCAHQYS